MNINEIYELAKSEADKLTAEMNAIFEPYKEECEAPEFMPEPDRNKWDELHKVQRGIFEKITRLEQVAANLIHYLKMEVI